MEDYFKYLTCSNEDLNWGFFLTVAGKATIYPGSGYPPSGHPKGYHFSWSNGRILQEYQINYITEGEGMLETDSGKYSVKAGMILIIRPGQWHRYKPVSSKGWKEHYIGFNGVIAEKAIESFGFLKAPIVQIGFSETVLTDFQTVINLVRDEKPGYQQICSGYVMQILGHIISIVKGRNFYNNPLEDVIKKSCLIIRDNMHQTLRINDLSKQLGINYSVFRKSFKKYTGLSPNQYHLALRIKQASHHLINTNDSIKEISFNLGFCSVFYFSKLYKEKTGLSPSEFRKRFSK